MSGQGFRSRRPRCLQRPGHGWRGRPRAAGACTSRTGFSNGPARAAGRSLEPVELYHGAWRASRAAAQLPASSTASGSTPGPSTTACSTPRRLLGQPFHYRDERHRQRGRARARARPPRASSTSRSGLQYLPFNTVYQLAAGRIPIVGQGAQHPAGPDLLAYWPHRGRSLSVPMPPPPPSSTCAPAW